MNKNNGYTVYSSKEELHIESKAVHGALGTEPCTGAVSMPIFQTATFRHPELECSTGYAYSRLENPTRQELERTMAKVTVEQLGGALEVEWDEEPNTCNEAFTTKQGGTPWKIKRL